MHPATHPLKVTISQTSAMTNTVERELIKHEQPFVRPISKLPSMRSCPPALHHKQHHNHRGERKKSFYVISFFEDRERSRRFCNRWNASQHHMQLMKDTLKTAHYHGQTPYPSWTKLSFSSRRYYSKNIDERSKLYTENSLRWYVQIPKFVSRS